MNYEPVIGLEVHAQAHTCSKMFCGCPVMEDTGDLAPNTYVCPVCLALPGALPVVNRRAVEIGMRAALALNCEVRPHNVFARKSYFYPDLPKGYQISQYELPLAEHGYLDLETEAGPRRIGITRLHLEEDAGKLTHTAQGALVDLNRAGVPLLEIVSEPDLRTVEEVRAYATLLREILIAVGVNAGDMEKGMMRFEANVSVRPAGAETLGVRTEIKNLNSFRALTRSVEYEIARQIAVLESGGRIVQQTLGWDDARGVTYPQRGKEHAHDYRYFPDPDIPPLEIPAEWIAAVQADLPELPHARRRRLCAQYGIRAYDAELLVVDRAVADYFEAAVQAAPAEVAPQELANWLTGELFRLLNDAGMRIAACKVTPVALGALLALWQQGTISVTAAKSVLGAVFETGETPAEAVKRLGLAQISDVGAIEALVAQIMAENSGEVEKYLAGKESLLGWFVGQVMRASKGKANPQQAQALVKQYLERAALQ